MIIRENAGLTKAVIFPGEFYVADTNCAMMALVGSCVCVCLYDPVNGVAGMSQFMLPVDEDISGIRISNNPRDFGAKTMKEFTDGMAEKGADRRFLRAGVCGGSSFYIPSDYEEHFDQVGLGTSHFIREYMRKEGINIVGSDLGGNTGRIVRFETRDYFINIRKIKSVPLTGLAYRDREYWKTVIKKPYDECLAGLKRTA